MLFNSSFEWNFIAFKVDTISIKNCLVVMNMSRHYNFQPRCYVTGGHTLYIYYMALY